ncbi:MAG TPA: hypothetical protein VKA55_05945 [Gammaproteobacteria bacterium]|nr:hypothetical protein [Gammaproteobacteria bacterium]
MAAGLLSAGGTWRGPALGAVLAAATAAPLALLPPVAARAAAANLLTLIAAVYVGMAMAGASRRFLVIQITGAAGFFLLAVLGLWLDGWWIVAGLVLHGLWDLPHHQHPAGVVPAGYPGLCAVYDWVLVLFLAALFGAV